MESALSNRFSEIRTLAGQGIDEPYATLRMDYNPYFGFSAQILTPKNGDIYIDPYARGDIHSISAIIQKIIVGMPHFHVQ